MRKVIIVGEEPKEEKALKPIEFTHYLDVSVGWTSAIKDPSKFGKIVYLGKCILDGDMFAIYEGCCIEIYKGHLNDGVY